MTVDELVDGHQGQLKEAQTKKELTMMDPRNRTTESKVICLWFMAFLTPQ